MLRRSFILGMAGALVAGLPALADYKSQVVLQLTQQGYKNIQVSRTWLGRVRILAHRQGGVREIVLNPRTGEILRDIFTAANGKQGTISILDQVNPNGRSSSGGGGKIANSGGSGGSSGGGTSGDGSSGDGSSDGGSSDGGSSGGSTGGVSRKSVIRRLGSGGDSGSGEGSDN